MSASGVRISILLFCSQSVRSVDEVLESLLAYVREQGPSHELIVALDGQLVGLYARFQERLAEEPQATLIALHSQQGQVATIRAGLAVANGQWIVTFPSYPQVDTDAIAPVLEGLAGGADYIVGYRVGRRGSLLKRLASRSFNQLVHATTGVAFRDLACGIHGMRSAVSRAVPNYGDNQLYLPILLAREGFRVAEVAVPAGRSEPGIHLFSPAALARRGLDVLALSYLVRFTQKPLRPFGAVGVVLTFIGSVLCVVLDQPLADRPLLLLALLLVTSGIQIVILGFLGELLIYLHFRDQVNYRVQEEIGGTVSPSASEKAERRHG
jgi:hypothetical protein